MLDHFVDHHDQSWSSCLFKKKKNNKISENNCRLDHIASRNYTYTYMIRGEPGSRFSVFGENHSNSRLAPLPFRRKNRYRVNNGTAVVLGRSRGDTRGLRNVVIRKIQFSRVRYYTRSPYTADNDGR